MKLNLYFFTLLTITIVACKSPHYSSENWPATYLSTGSFGGFSGLKSSTFILPNGQMFTENSMESKKVEINAASKKVTKNLFKSADKLNWDKLPADNFGNMNYFISYHTKDTTYTSIWGQYGQEPPAELGRLFQQIQTLIIQ
jgi:hypothetical protein